MKTLPFQSNVRRFLKKFGVAFLWASVIGTGFGATAYFRVPRFDGTQSAPFYVRARLLLERLEWLTYDWRVRELAENVTRSDAVVAVAIDEETVSSAQYASQPMLAVQPWPREVYGKLLEQALREEASMVIFDTPFVSPSGRLCSNQPASTDDDSFREAIERQGGKALLTFSGTDMPARPPDRDLKPWLVKIDEASNAPLLVPAVRKVLSNRAPAYVQTVEGKGMMLWAGASSEQQAKELASRLDVKGTPAIRPLDASDARAEVNGTWLLRHLARVDVKGLDVGQVWRLRDVRPPVAALLTSAAQYGVSEDVADADGVVRAMPLLITVLDEDAKPVLLASAALSAAMRVAGTDNLRYDGGRLHVGDKYAVPMDKTGFVYLRWDTPEIGSGARGPLKRALPAWRLWVNHEDEQSRRGAKHYENELKGRVAVITEAQSTARTLRTPVGEMMHGAVLGETIVNLLEKGGIDRVDPKVDFWLTVALAFVGALLAVAFSSALRSSGWLSLVLAVGGVALIHLLVARSLFVSQQRWIAVAAPLLAMAGTFLAAQGYAEMVERRFRDFVTRALGTAIRADVFQRVDRNVGLMRPERRPLAIYFSDVEGFTGASHLLEPRAVVSLLQSYLSDVTQAVLDSQGQVDKYLGDGVMAFWGAPVHLEAPAEAACDAALQMRDLFDRHKAVWEKQAKRPLILRAGLDYGECVVGEMGTEHRLNYSVMGDAVAQAARLEQLGKGWGVRLLVGQALMEAAKERFYFREIDTVRLSRTGQVGHVYELLGRGKPNNDEKEFLAQYHAALGAYRMRDFTRAGELFGTLLLHRSDEVCKRHKERCAKYARQAPPSSWDGVYVDP